MSTRVKAGLCLALFVVLCGVYGYLTWDASRIVAQQWIALGPINWIDFGSGAFITFFTMMVIFVGISLRESIRFEREFEKNDPGGSNDPSGGTPKRVRLPMRRKAIDIKSWQPPDGNYHRHAEASA